jgi:hypothetical protein
MQGWGSALLNAGLTGLQGGGLGDMLKSGALSAAGGKLANWGSNLATGSLPMVGTAGITNAIADAAGNALSGAARSAIQGQDILSGAATGAGGSLIGSGAQGIAGLIPGNLTGVSAIDRATPGVVANTIRGAVQGQNLGTVLAGNVLGAAGREAGAQVANALPSTGSNWLDNFLKSSTRNLSGQAASSLVGAPQGRPAASQVAQQVNPINQAYAPLSGVTPIASAPVNNQGNLLNYLSLAQMAGQPQSDGAPAVASNIPAFNLEQMFSSAPRQQGSLQQLLQSYNQGRVA